MIKKEKIKYTIELIILLSIYIVLAPIFQSIIDPFIKLFIDNSLSINLILIELAKFSIINILLLKVKNERIKKLLIFLSMLTYTLGYNLLMFLMTIAFQNIKKFNYINIAYTYFIILIGMIAYKYRMISFIDYLVEIKYIIINALVILFIVFLINMIIFIKYKSIILESNIIKTVLNTCIISVIIYITLNHLEYENSDLNIQLIIYSAITLINMCVFYYLNISIFEKRIIKMIYLLFLYYIFYFYIYYVISYKVVSFIILTYDIILVYSEYRNIRLDKIERLFDSFIVGICIFFIINISSIIYGNYNYTQTIISFIIGIINVCITYYFSLNILQKKVYLLMITLFIYFILSSNFQLPYSYKVIAIIIIVYDIIIVSVEYILNNRNEIGV